MSLRRIASIGCALALVLLVGVAPAGAVKNQTPPTTPTNLRITASTATSISLAWDASTKRSNTFWYCVQQSLAGCIRVDPPQTTITRTGLLPDRTFSFTVYAIDAAGNRSANSNAVTYTTPPDTTAPSPPPVLSLVSVYPTRISAAWSASVDNLSQTFYTLLLDGSPHGADLINYRAVTILRLTPSTTHVLEVRARDAYGNVAASNVLTVTTPAVTDTVAPTPPTNLTFSFQTSPPEAWLDWVQSTDNVDPQSQILYDVYLNGVRTDDGVIGWGSTVTFCRVSGPTEIVLRAVDTSGNVSTPSNALQFDC